MIIPLDGVTPTVDPTAYVQESAQVIGDVHIGPESSIWFHTVLRGDVHHIRVGARTSIQDNSTVHVTSGRYGTLIGDDVTVGHGVILHGCTVGNGSLVGIGAIVLDACEIGEQSLIGAGALVTPGTVVPPRSLVLGQPAKVVRPLRADELAGLATSAQKYVLNGARYKSQKI